MITASTALLAFALTIAFATIALGATLAISALIMHTLAIVVLRVPRSIATLFHEHACHPGALPCF